MANRLRGAIPRYLLEPSTELYQLYTLTPDQLKEVTLILSDQLDPTVPLGYLTFEETDFDDFDFKPKLHVPTQWIDPALTEDQVTNLIQTFAQSEFPQLAQRILSHAQQKLRQHQAALTNLQQEISQLQTHTAALPTSLTFESFTAPLQSWA